MALMVGVGVGDGLRTWLLGATNGDARRQYARVTSQQVRLRSPRYYLTTVTLQQHGDEPDVTDCCNSASLSLLSRSP
jgi:hypothetical protein